MADPEIIDLTNSPPSSPPRPNPRSRTNRRRSRRILSFRASSSSRTIHFKIRRPCQPTQNPSYGHITHQVVPWFPPSPYSQICNFSQIVNNFHSTMHGGDLAMALAQPHQFQPLVVNEPNMAAPTFTTFLVTEHSEAWTPYEHEQFVNGLAKYGGCWARIASELVVSKTGEQVESYAISFFRHLTYICLYNLRMNDQSASFTTFLTFPYCVTTIDNFNPRMMEDPPTLMLFPLINGGRCHRQARTSCTSTRTRTNTCGRVNNNVVAPNPNMVVAATTDAEELDLELRLG